MSQGITPTHIQAHPIVMEGDESVNRIALEFSRKTERFIIWLSLEQIPELIDKLARVK